MASKICVLFAALVLAGVALPIAHAQQGILSNLLNITGTVPCSLGGSVPVSTTNVFPNAAVQLNCGGNVIASTTTNSNGVFSLVANVSPSLLPSLLSSCSVVVTTPLVTCNVNLPSTGTLTASVLNTAGNTIGSTLGTTLNLVTGVFTLVSNLIP